MRLGVVASEEFPEWDLVQSFLTSLGHGTSFVMGSDTALIQNYVVPKSGQKIELVTRFGDTRHFWFQQAHEVVSRANQVVVFDDGKDEVARYVLGCASFSSKVLGWLRPCLFRSPCAGALTWGRLCAYHNDVSVPAKKPATRAWVRQG